MYQNKIYILIDVEHIQNIDINIYSLRALDKTRLKVINPSTEQSPIDFIVIL